MDAAQADDHTGCMRRLLLLLVAAAIVPQPASAARVDPQAYVLGAGDVPARYDLDRDNSTVLPRALVARDEKTRRLLDRAGYVSGYLVRSLDAGPSRWKYVDSSAFVFRTASGASTYLAWLDGLARQQSAGAPRRAVGLGSGGWSYVSRSLGAGTRIVWRSGRVVAMLACYDMTGHRALAFALARAQQARIAAAPH
jgi:hypothetical protein